VHNRKEALLKLLAIGLPQQILDVPKLLIGQLASSVFMLGGALGHAPSCYTVLTRKQRF
jgi:hypothetical protein